MKRSIQLLSAAAVLASVTFGIYQMQRAEALEQELAQQTQLTEQAYASLSHALEQIEKERAKTMALLTKE